MYKNHGIELLPRCLLTPVTLDELKAAIVGVQDTMDELHFIAHGVEFKRDTDRNSQHESIRIWPDLYYVWDYAEHGNFRENFFATCADDFFSDVVNLLSAINGYNAYHGDTYGQDLLKVIFKFCARIKLDFDSDFDTGLNTPFGEVVPLQCAWFPQIPMKDLSPLELALLAGMTRSRSVRNAQRFKENSLNFYKAELKVLVTVADARKWLAGRKGFVPSTNLPTAEGVVH